MTRSVNLRRFGWKLNKYMRERIAIKCNGFSGWGMESAIAK
ncbi:MULTISPECIES: hypothetical protein [Oscillatoriales]|nr:MULTISPECIES: hypothetical protein [Oscillatoriales]